ncbi:MAG: hypothetical protein NTW27_06070 [Deltaproteobacteria bacterium]|nr:hypothetical protein [Deltaproteobacteria bacterium]
MPTANNYSSAWDYTQTSRTNPSTQSTRKFSYDSSTKPSLRSQFGDRLISSGRKTPDGKIDQEIRQVELDRLRELLDLERRRNIAEREERQRALDEKFARETDWRRLMQKAALAYRVGKFGAGWTWADDAYTDRLGVEMGYLKPWDRRYQVKVGVGK